MSIRREIRVRAALGACAIAYLCGIVVASEMHVPASLAGLASTTPRADEESFRLPSADLPSDDVARFLRGKTLFEVDLVRRLADEKGVEPRPRNGNGCSDCHLGGGRNAVREESERSFPFSPMVVFPPAIVKSPAPNDAHRVVDAAPFPHVVTISWQPTQMLVDGYEYSLTYPRVSIDGAVVAGAHVRITPSLIGLGLLEQISDTDIMEWYHTHKSGRFPQVDNQGAQVKFGRFGLKSTSVSVLDFVKTALHDELRIVDQNALSRAQIEDLAYYAAELGVPKRQIENPQVAAGYAIFERLGCADCHRAKYEIRRQYGPDAVAMTIWPFSDLLLHDLSYPDQTDEGGRQFWRTTPLWGLGRVETTLGYGAYLHDGRARSLQEAILWHGGEAAPSRYLFLESSSDARSTLMAFLKSL